MAQRIDMEHRGWSVVVRRGRRGFIGLANRPGREPSVTFEHHGKNAMRKAALDVVIQVDVEETLAEAGKGEP